MQFWWGNTAMRKQKMQKFNRINDRFVFTPSGNVLVVKKILLVVATEKQPAQQILSTCLGLVSQSVYLCIEYKIDIQNAVATTWPTMQLRCATLASSAAAWLRGLQSCNEGIHQHGPTCQHRNKQVQILQHSTATSKKTFVKEMENGDNHRNLCSSRQTFQWKSL